ncbi:MAG: hypothetical protein KBI47_07740 [Armatimonadetes bacterium]|nr:hypothetical protein [Armatimonadota bacterium]
MMRVATSLVMCLVAHAAVCLTIDGENLGQSKMIPRQGDTVRFIAPVLNESKEPFAGDVTLSMRVARAGEPLSAAETITLPLELEPGASRDFAFNWTFDRNGWYRLVFECTEPDMRLEREVAVTANDVYFVWFGAPREFRWCNVPTTVKDEDQDWWLRRGAIPAHWKCGVCCKQMTVEQFVENWGRADWIAIDEVGGPGEVTDKFIEAWKRLKEAKPEQFTAVWYMGAHAYWADIKDLVDLFVPEIYLNYRGNHLGQFDAYLQTAQDAGVLDQVIPGLGINEIRDDDKRITNSPTRDDVLRQFRYLKRAWPDLRGIGFFTSSSARWGVAEYADELCGAYYIDPVLTIIDPHDPIRIDSRPPEDSEVRVALAGVEDTARWARVRVRNVGNMDAEGVTLEIVAAREGDSSRAAWTCLTTNDWPVGETRCFVFPAGDLAGPVRVRLVPHEDYTVLDGTAERYVAPAAWERERKTLVTVEPGDPAPVRLPGFVPVNADGAYRLVSANAPPRSAAVLPPRPGTDEKLAAFALPQASSVGYSVAALEPGEAPAVAPEHSREGDLLRVSNAFYRVALDLKTDRVTEIGVAGGAGNILRGPWTLSAAGHAGFGEPRVQELPGCLVVTIPYDSPQASGESQYVFFEYSPAIRIARSWVPKGEITLKGASDRCDLFQNGGSYALQPGVGGSVRRGYLHDSDKYRDLLFGYLGSAPEPANADRAGWIDFSYDPARLDGGMGVVIDYRWVDSGTQSYDVTRLYDGSDWLEVLYLWGKEATFSRPQKSCVYLVPHRSLDFTDPAVTPPGKALWDVIHRAQIDWTQGLPPGT